MLHKKGHVLGLIFKIGAMSSDFCWDNTALEAHVLALEKPLPYVCLQKMMLMYVIIWESEKNNQTKQTHSHTQLFYTGPYILAFLKLCG